MIEMIKEFFEQKQVDSRILSYHMISYHINLPVPVGRY